MSQRENEQLPNDGDRTPTNTEMVRVLHEALDNNVAVNGWQKGIEDMPGFALVTDNITGATFAVKCGEPLVDALDRMQMRMAGNCTTTCQSEGTRTD